MSHDTKKLYTCAQKTRLETNNYRGAQKYKIIRKQTKYIYRVKKSDANDPRVLLK